MFLVEHFVANGSGPVAVPDVEIAQVGIVLDEVEGRCGRPGDQAQLVEQGGMHRSGVRRGDEYNALDRLDKDSRFFITVGASTVCRAQDLLDH